MVLGTSWNRREAKTRTVANGLELEYPAYARYSERGEKDPTTCRNLQLWVKEMVITSLETVVKTEKNK